MRDRQTIPEFYNIFETTGSDGVLCAIRQDLAIPEFLESGEWGFVCATDGTTGAPPGFAAGKAAEAMSLTGYYLFAEGTAAG